MLYKRLPNFFPSAFVLVSPPCEHEARPPTETNRDDRIRAKVNVVFKFENLPDNRCRFTYLSQPGIGGSVPKWIMNFYAKMNLMLTVRLQEYFQKRF